MIGQLQHSSSWTGRVMVFATALLGFMLHSGGAPERALVLGGAAVVVGTLMGLAMLAIVVARLLGRNIGLIRSDVSAMFALLFMIAIKIVIARIFVS